MINNELWFNQKADKISCYSVNGQLIDFCENCEQLSAKNLNPGIYIFTIYYKNNQLVYKLSK
jgi:hypothetical protein